MASSTANSDPIYVFAKKVGDAISFKVGGPQVTDAMINTVKTKDDFKGFEITALKPETLNKISGETENFASMGGRGKTRRRRPPLGKPSRPAASRKYRRHHKTK